MASLLSVEEVSSKSANDRFNFRIVVNLMMMIGIDFRFYLPTPTKTRREVIDRSIDKFNDDHRYLMGLPSNDDYTVNI